MKQQIQVARPKKQRQEGQKMTDEPCVCNKNGQMINKWISKRSRDVAGKFEIHRNQGDITEKRNEQKIQIMCKPEISREIHLEFSKQESTGSCTFLPVDLSVNPLTKSLNCTITWKSRSPDRWYQFSKKQLLYIEKSRCRITVEWVLGSKREDRVSNPFFWAGPKNVSGSFFVPSSAW